MPINREQEWLQTFYRGTLLVKGWKQRMREVLHEIPPAERHHIKILLTNLGDKIGREWAKDNSRRRIDTQMLQTWGENLMQAKLQGVKPLEAEIHNIDQTVDRILQQT